MLSNVVRVSLIGLVKLLIGAHPRWIEAAPDLRLSLIHIWQRLLHLSEY